MAGNQGNGALGDRALKIAPNGGVHWVGRALRARRCKAGSAILRIAVSAPQHPIRRLPFPRRHDKLLAVISLQASEPQAERSTHRDIADFTPTRIEDCR